MTTVTIDILNEKAITLLKDLELLKLIRLRREKEEPKTSARLSTIDLSYHIKLKTADIRKNHKIKLPIVPRLALINPWEG